MLFHVKMTVNLPVDMDPARAAQLKTDEKQLAQRLQRDGTWRHLWRIAGHYANYSVFDVPSVEALHDIKGQGIYVYVTLKNGEEPSEQLRLELKNWVRKE
uniref:muconolactone Delta-isomerase family protein n=1 Tax=Pseudomonas sp. TaxID=306 RepID=UPI002896BA3B